MNLRIKEIVLAAADYFDVTPGDAKTIDMRAFLRSGKDALTETWANQWILGS